MSSYGRFFRNRPSTPQMIVTLILLLLLSPAFYHAENWMVNHLHARFFKKAPAVPAAVVDLYAERMTKTSLRLLRDRRVSIVRVNLPCSVLNYRRTIASGEKGASTYGGQVEMWAVSKNARLILESNGINYVDPNQLPHGVSETFHLPFATSNLQNYLLIQDYFDGAKSGCRING